MSTIQDLFFNSINNIPEGDFSNLRGALQTIISTASSNSLNSWKPRVDIVENKENIIIYIEIPGVTGNDIELEFENNNLFVKGCKNPSYTRSSNSTIKKEITYGPFNRKIVLPICVNNEENIKAKYRQGILHVIINKKENKNKIKISVPNEKPN